MRLEARIAGIGLVGPGLADWASGREVLAGRAPFALARTAVPVAEALPPTERRRAGQAVKLALAVGLEAARAAGVEPGECTTVFASSGGETENCHAICEALASDDRLISPTRFHNSVHNAPAGYWGIATGDVHAADCVGAFDGSATAGLLEAMVRVAAEPERPVLLIAYDTPYPGPLGAARPIADAFGVAILLRAANSAGGPKLCARAGPGAAGTMDGPIEAIRRGIPAARLLPLLHCVARGGGEAILDYLEDLSLHVEVAA